MTMKGVITHLFHSLYARIALVYLASLLVLSVAGAWVAVSQFGELNHELQQRMQINLADKLAQVMRAPLAQGADSAAARDTVQHIHAINPELSLLLLSDKGDIVADYSGHACDNDARVDTAPLKRLLSKAPMLPVFVSLPCSPGDNIFSVAPVRYGPERQAGYLLVILHSGAAMSMDAMLRTSSITRALVATGLLALLLSAIGGLLLFALLTRRFSRLTHTVRRFAEGDLGLRMNTDGKDEISQLARAFNDMAGTIEAQLTALHESDRQRRELVAGLSHDFRTPLTSLRGYAAQLAAQSRAADEPSGKHREAVDAILANSRRLTHLAEQLSTLARVDVNENALCLEPFSLAELVHDVAGKFAPQAEAAGIRLTVQAAPGAVRVAADIGLIDRAITNLVENALHATSRGGQVTLTLETGAGKARLCVSDTGVGINREDLPLVTQRFYRTRTGRQRSDGSGLGLAIVQDICSRHATRLTLASQPGAGTQAEFELPLADPRDQIIS